jgi:hypothetical protein
VKRANKHSKHSFRTYVIGVSIDSVKVLVTLGRGHVEVFTHFVDVVLILIVFIIVLVLKLLK